MSLSLVFSVRARLSWVLGLSTLAGLHREIQGSAVAVASGKEKRALHRALPWICHFCTHHSGQLFWFIFKRKEIQAEEPELQHPGTLGIAAPIQFQLERG